MRKKWAILIVAALTLQMLTACGNNEDNSTADYALESVDIVEGTETAAETIAETIESETISETIDAKTAQETENSAEIEAEQVEAVIYYSNDMADGLEEEQITLEGLTAENLISSLKIHNIASIDTQVKEFHLQNGDEANGISGTVLNLDLNKAFGEYLCTMGSSGEYIIMAALTNTFLENYQAEAIYITVEGKTIETGHSSYDEPFYYYEF